MTINTTGGNRLGVSMKKSAEARGQDVLMAVWAEVQRRMVGREKGEMLFAISISPEGCVGKAVLIEQKKIVL